MYFNIHSGSCAPAGSQGQGVALLGAPRMQRDLPSLATIFSQALSRPGTIVYWLHSYKGYSYQGLGPYEGLRMAMDSSRSCASGTGEGAAVSGQAADWVLGKAITSRIEETPAISMTRRSRPKAIPPCGGQP